jgi:hypothetical protein
LQLNPKNKQHFFVHENPIYYPNLKNHHGVVVKDYINCIICFLHDRILAQTNQNTRTHTATKNANGPSEHCVTIGARNEIKTERISEIDYSTRALPLTNWTNG